ncbi:hypothetical protein P3X46_014234 [Hevea brasiliensis]|uniref:TPX2 C-terminal domain-containing protein n=1 Tax=Hevea brasiliensis TaxID=3981 RepID=A0ABQ9M9P9_HEVBR|nr:hypothetical protein P3X46_014234 [Hevea brasiliensis]
MKSLSSVGLGLSVVFGCLLLALVAELYYLLWWKRRFTNREIGDEYSNPARELFYMFCLKKPSSLRHSQELCSSVRITDTLVHHEQDSRLHNTSKDLLLKPLGDDPMETQLMRLNSLSGPPRFLFTIIEETKEDLESEDGKSRGDNKSAKGSRSRSLSDLLLNIETPYLTPLASPPFFTPPLTPMDHLFESAADAEFNKIRSSPPPKFKFLQDAEEKLYRRKLREEVEEKVQKNDGFAQAHAKKVATSKFLKDEEDGSFITINVDKNREIELNHQNHHLPQYHSSTSQVLPLASSPSRFTSAAKKSPIFH